MVRGEGFEGLPERLMDECGAHSGAAPCAVYAFSSGSEDLPRGERAMARIKTPMVTGSGKSRAVRMDWLPIIFQAETQEAAREKAETWWATEIDRERRKVEAVAARTQALRAKAEGRS